MVAKSFSDKGCGAARPYARNDIPYSWDVWHH